VRILIDTQIFLWLFGFVNRISTEVEALLKNSNNEIYFSSASAWEIAIKYGNGKLQLPDAPEIYVPNRIYRANFKWLEIQHEHALAVAKLPLIHKNPFDRLLIAQANAENLTILSADKIFAQYNVKFIDSSAYRI
jgi:PIN domain nuclease of toxin-antitoxin system